MAAVVDDHHLWRSDLQLDTSLAITVEQLLYFRTRLTLAQSLTCFQVQVLSISYHQQKQGGPYPCNNLILLIDDAQQPTLHQVCPSLILLGNCGFLRTSERVVERDAVA